MSTAYPLSPKLQNGALTVSAALKNPTLITHRINALAAESLIAGAFFSSKAGLDGGTLLYTQELPGDLYTSRDVEARSVGDEYAIVGSDERPLNQANPEDWGGKFFVPAETIKRNLASALDDDVTKLTNTIVRKIDEAALKAVEAAIADQPGGAGHFPGNDWGDVILTGNTPTVPAETPTGDFANAQLVADRDELGITYNTLVLNPTERSVLATIYGKDLSDVLASAGLKLRTSMRVEAGTGYFVQESTAGVIAFEEPLNVKTWEDQAKRGVWVQGFAVPAIAVTRPRAVLKITGLAG